MRVPSADVTCSTARTLRRPRTGEDAARSPRHGVRGRASRSLQSSTARPGYVRVTRVRAARVVFALTGSAHFAAARSAAARFKGKPGFPREPVVMSTRFPREREGTQVGPLGAAPAMVGRGGEWKEVSDLVADLRRTPLDAAWCPTLGAGLRIKSEPRLTNGSSRDVALDFWERYRRLGERSRGGTMRLIGSATT